MSSIPYGAGTNGDLYGNILGLQTHRLPQSTLYALVGTTGGGGQSTIVDPNPSFSTVTMNGALFMQNNTISLSIGGQSQLYYNVANNNTYLIGLSSPTEAVHIGTQNDPNVAIINDNGLVINGNEVITGDLSISTISNVSTINGAPYPPTSGGYTATTLAWLNGGSNTIPPSLPSTIPLTVASAALTSGHTYRVSAALGFSNTLANGATSIFMEGITATGGLPALLVQDPNIVTGASIPYAGFTGYFTVAGGGASGFVLSGSNSGTGATDVTSDQSFIIVEDLGAI